MSLIIVADTHIRPGSDGERAFFEMLDILGAGAHDVVFLGDIFDLWIGLSGYEGPSQAAFLDWCSRQKKSRRIGFIEGNHEFFVSQTHGDCFSWSTSESAWRDTEGRLFVHGDRINSSDRRYLMFRRLTKNAVVRRLLRFLPGGPHLCNLLNQALRHSNPRYRRGLPEAQIHQYADRMFADGVDLIFVGHFHTTYRYAPVSSCNLYLVPAWLESGQVTLVDTGDHHKGVEFISWEELPL